MASEHPVLLTRISAIKPHPNADNLEIAEIEGWQTLPSKGEFKVGDKVIFIPVDSVVPDEWAEKWNIKKYLGGSRHDRVRCARLRGEPSYGFAVAVPDELKDTKVGTDVKDFFGITKYLPPVRNSHPNAPQGKARVSHPLFDKYTGIENLRNYKNLFYPGEQVYVTEKIHGANVRISYLDTQVERKDFWSRVLRFLQIKNRMEWTEEFVCGSHNVQREIPEDPTTIPYTYPLTIPGVRELLSYIKLTHGAKQVILYGEVFGPKIQKINYGVKEGFGFMAFDIKVDGEYLNVRDFEDSCDTFKIPRVPVLYEGPFIMETIQKLSEGKTTVKGANHVIEGTVVKPIIESRTLQGKRKILKCKGADYMMWKESKKGSDYTEE